MEIMKLLFVILNGLLIRLKVIENSRRWLDAQLDWQAPISATDGIV